jgi:tetratricopeptide (TPR) repeat protein
VLTKRATVLMAITLTAVALLFLGGCERPPDSAAKVAYLRDYEQARDILDVYHGRDEDLVRAASITRSLHDAAPSMPHAYVALARLVLDGGAAPDLFENFQQKVETALTALGRLVFDPKAAHIVVDAPEGLLKQALTLDPDLCDAHIALGRLYFVRERYAAALEELDRADRLKCTSPWRLIHKAQVYIEFERFDDAAALLDQVPVASTTSSAVKRAPYVRALASKIWIAFIRGDRAAMIALSHEELALLDPDDPWGVGNVAWSLIDAGVFDEAVANAREALRRMDYGKAKSALGTALYGNELWAATHGSSPRAPSPQQLSEAKGLIGTVDAVNNLWFSLANRDVAFRGELVDRLLKERALLAARKTQRRSGP